MKLHRYLLSYSALVVLLITSCGTGEDNEDAHEAGDNDYSEESFDIAWNAQPPTLDPLATTSFATREISRNFFEPLVVTDADGELQPVLAESWEVSDDAQEIVFVLRENVLFHDGSTMGAEDVAASLGRWVESTAIGQRYFSESTIETRDEEEVVLVLERPMQVAVELLADQAQLPVIMPAEIAGDAPDDGVEELVGTGPYKFTEWETDQYIRLDRFDDYESPSGVPSGSAGEKEPFFKTLYFHLVPDSSTRVAGIQTGEYDAAVTIPIDNVSMLENDDDITLDISMAGLMGGVFNKSEGIMADENMRKAVVAAVEQEEIMLSAFGDESYFTTIGSLMPEENQWYSTAGQELLKEGASSDVEEFLEKSGYSGERIRILASREYDYNYNLAIPLQNALENHGMNVELVVVDWPAFLDMRTDPSSYEIFINGPNPPPAVPVSFPFFGKEWAGWTDSESIDEALENIIFANNEEGVFQANDDLHEAFHEYSPFIIFGEMAKVTAINSEFEGFQFTRETGEIFYNIQPVD